MTGDDSTGVSVAVRLGALQGLRLLAATVAIGTALVRQSAGLPVGLLVAWAAATTVLEAVRRSVRGRPVGVGVLLLADAVLLEFAADATGGDHSPLFAVAFLHVVLVTSLVGSLAGLRIALAHAYSLYLAHVVAVVGTVGTIPPAGLAAVHAAAFLLVAAGVAGCARLQARTARRGRSELRSLADLGPPLAATRTADDVTAVLADAAATSFGFARAVALHRVHGAGWRGARRGPDGEVLVELGGSAVDHLIEEAISTAGPLAVRQLDEASPLELVLPDASDVAIVAVAGSPDVVLAAEWDRGRGRELRVETLAALVEAVSHGAAAAEAGALRVELHRLATHDGLTGLVNRACFDDRLATALADPRALPVSVALLDLDRFKEVNDTYGHQAGDEVLRRVAVVVEAVVRPGDVAARYGGEELVVLLPRCSASDAATVAERLRAAVADDGCEPRVTASIGTATTTTAAAPQDLLAAADEALYQAKATGRDRVVAAA